MEISIYGGQVSVDARDAKLNVNGFHDGISQVVFYDGGGGNEICINAEHDQIVAWANKILERAAECQRPNSITRRET